MRYLGVGNLKNKTKNRKFWTRVDQEAKDKVW